MDPYVWLSGALTRRLKVTEPAMVICRVSLRIANAVGSCSDGSSPGIGSLPAVVIKLKNEQ
ncbi:hypothetical protein IH785_14620 [candidate division KSB1 bacterium]|nr:hypothetical protein [candidate division KSB1 bacterium]